MFFHSRGCPCPAAGRGAPAPPRFSLISQCKSSTHARGREGNKGTWRTKRNRPRKEQKNQIIRERKEDLYTWRGGGGGVWGRWGEARVGEPRVAADDEHARAISGARLRAKSVLQCSVFRTRERQDSHGRESHQGIGRCIGERRAHASKARQERRRVAMAFA